jgi:sulfide dehydrogenase cytochrome subunit
MSNKTSKTTLLSAIAMSAMFFSCQKELVEKKAELPQSVSAATATLDHPGRTLAANCFQCHGTNGYAGELKIATQSASSIVNKFNSYRAKPANADIMYVHAYAYTPEEINLIADYFSKQ